MERQFINQLGEQEQIDEIFLVSEKQLRPNRAGNLYLQLRLTDKTGWVNAMLWNANQQVAEGFDSGDFVRVQGKSQFYNGALQLILNKVTKVDESQIDGGDFETLSSGQVDQLMGSVSEMLRGMKNVHLRNLAECFLVDEALMDQFQRAPAGIKNHHAYQGGLLEHVTNLMALAQSVAPHYSAVDPDLLVIGAFLHDIGKVIELTYERDLGYSDEGQLIGHVVLAIPLVETKIKETESLSGEPFPEELALRIKHMVISHHGEYEYGSPRLPMTPEAIALHFLDNMDAKIHCVSHLIEEDVNPNSRWTTYHPMIGRKLFKGGSPPDES